MAKMGQSELLEYLNAEADSAYQFMSGQNARDRTQAMRDYLRLPYGNEEEGRSAVVASDVFDSVEGMLPDLIEVFVSTDEAVRFDPVGPEDEEGAKQATNACNYVFYKQNNGFHILYTSAKDALMLKTGAVKWYWEEKRTPSFTTYRDVTEDALAMFVMQNPKAMILERSEQEPEEGKQPGLFTVKVKTVETKGQCKVVPIPPDELRVSRLHNSVLLDDCPYVAHVCRRTKSQIQQMGFRVTDEDMKAAESEETTTDRELRDILRDDYMRSRPDAQDPSQREGYLREEYVLVDFDGDGIAERRRILRLGQKVLENEECSHVQIAGWTPYILTHRFDGLSVADLTSDFQRIQTELIRQSLDNVALANNNESVVLTDSAGSPKANIDDLLNRRAGGIIREFSPGAVRPYNEHWKGVEAFPLVEMIDTKKENRTGFTRYSQGLDSNSLNKTAHGLQQIMNASQKRQKLMARIMAEALVAPMFRGIFKTLTDYCMDKLAFRLNGQFVQYDPQEWRDGYDMTINVGIGAGDKMQQMQMLGGIEAAQATAVQAGGLGKVVTLSNLYNLQKRKVELAGFKDPGEFWTDPETVQSPPQQPPPPDPKVQIEGAKLQQDGQKFQATQQAEAQKMQADQAFKAAEAQKDRELQIAMKQMEQQFQAFMKSQETIPEEAPEEPEESTTEQVAGMLAQTVQVLADKMDGSKPMAVEKIRDAQGRMVGARITQMDGSVREVPIQ
jgi:hypothetical protein